jgi:hypothetical protein
MYFKFTKNHTIHFANRAGAGETDDVTYNFGVGSYRESNSDAANSHTISTGEKILGSPFGRSEGTSKTAVISTAGIFGFDGKKL